MDKLKKDFASKLLNVKAIKLQPNDPSHGLLAGSLLSIVTTARHCRSQSCATT